MLERTTAEIIKACQESVKNYTKQCTFSLAGKEGEERKLAFINLLATMQDDTPERAFLKIYDFYDKNQAICSSRLIDKIHDDLLWVLKYSNRDSSGRLITAQGYMLDEDYILKAAAGTIEAKLKTNLGGDIELSSFKKTN